MDLRKQIAVVFPLQLDPTLSDEGSMEGQSVTQHQFKTMFSSYGVLRGVFNFARLHNEWSLRFSENTSSGLKRFIKQCKPAGIVAHVSTRQVKNILEESGAKIVNVSSYLPDPGMPSVVADNAAIGEVAANHFLESGFRRAAFVGYPDVRFSDQRLDGFKKRFQTKGQTPVAYAPENVSAKSPMYSAANKDLTRWLTGLIKPVGIFCCNDFVASCIAETCRSIGIRVPEDVSLVGADNSELVCELSLPPLSSVRLSRERIGYLAAETLQGLLKGQRAPRMQTLVPPDGIEVRRSSDILAIEDVDLVHAMRFIRDNANKSIGVEDILREVPISRRLLEQKFRTILQKTPLEEIQRAHVDRAKNLLSSTEQTLAEIARSAGFNTNERLSVVFKQRVGMTPGEFRKQARLVR